LYFQELLLDDVKTAIGKALATDVAKKAATATCPYITGAMSNGDIVKADFDAL
jgi:hypothetical protein